MAEVGRRGFLRLIAAAPVAVPVVAREAAQKAGVTALGYGMPMAPSGSQSVGPGNDWIKDWARDVFSSAWKEARWQEIKSNPVGALDPDIASSKSLSLSAAVRIQRERNFVRMVENERRSVTKRFREAFGADFIPEDRQ